MLDNMFFIRIVEKNKKIVVKNLTEKEAREALVSAYDCIAKECENVTFKGLLTVNALDLEYFYVGIE